MESTKREPSHIHTFKDPTPEERAREVIQAEYEKLELADAVKLRDELVAKLPIEEETAREARKAAQLADGTAADTRKRIKLIEATLSAKFYKSAAKRTW